MNLKVNKIYISGISFDTDRKWQFKLCIKVRNYNIYNIVSFNQFIV